MLGLKLNHVSKRGYRKDLRDRSLKNSGRQGHCCSAGSTVIYNANWHTGNSEASRCYNVHQLSASAQQRQLQCVRSPVVTHCSHVCFVLTSRVIIMRWGPEKAWERWGCQSLQTGTGATLPNMGNYTNPEVQTQVDCKCLVTKDFANT